MLQTPNAKRQTPNAFSLPELIVSVAITAILMVGLSAFFSGTLHNLLQVQEETQESQRQFIVGEIVSKKFRGISAAPLNSLPANQVIYRNDREGERPFGFIGLEDNKLVMKDFMVFNGVKGTYFLDSEAGSLKEISGTTELYAGQLKNAAGFVAKGGNHYVTFPMEDTVKCFGGSCPTFTLSGEPLSAPTDIVTDGTDFYVTDSGNDRVVKVTAAGVVSPVATGFNYPTGIAYYDPGGSVDPALFVADTLNHRVKKIDIATQNVSTVVGEGTDDDCDGTALYCRLNLPTGLHVQAFSELYIADSGNNRVLKVSDPGDLTTKTTEEITFTLTDAPSKKISKIIYSINGIAPDPAMPDPALNLHLAHFEPSGQSLEAWLSTDITGSHCNMVTLNPGPPPVEECQLDYIELANVVFADSDQIMINNDTNTYTVTVDQALKRAYLSNGDLLTTFSSGDVAYLNREFNTGETVTLTLDLSGSTPDPAGTAFAKITAEVRDEQDQIRQTAYTAIRIGDGVLGTTEDVIEVVRDIGLNFPTGLNATHAASSLAKTMVNLNAGATEGNVGYINPADIPQFDYRTSDEFNITSLNFQLHGQVLEGTLVIDLDQDGSPDKTYQWNTSF